MADTKAVMKTITVSNDIMSKLSTHSAFLGIGWLHNISQNTEIYKLALHEQTDCGIIFSLFSTFLDHWNYTKMIRE